MKKFIAVATIVLTTTAITPLVHGRVISKTSSAAVKRMDGLTRVEGVVVAIDNIEGKYVVVVRDGQIYKAVECLGSSKYAKMGERWSCNVVAGTGVWKVKQDGREFDVPLMRWDSSSLSRSKTKK